MAKFFENDLVNVKNINKYNNNHDYQVSTHYRLVKINDDTMEVNVENCRNNVIDRLVIPKEDVEELKYYNHCPWTDYYPYELIERKSKCVAVVRAMDYKRIDNNGWSDEQQYEYKSNPNNEIIIIRKSNKNFSWKCGTMNFYPSTNPKAYRDPNF